MTLFTELPLCAELQQKLAHSNFTTLTPVQEAAMPHAFAGRDIVATAQTGTGKTLAFMLPLMEALMQTSSRKVEVLVLVPTRELAMQVLDVYEKLRNRKLPAGALVIGGMSEKNQIRSIRSGARLVVATPGRLEDFLRRRMIDLRSVKTLVLDESDRMLDMGFLPAIRRIMDELPAERQTLCFSATLEKSVAALVNDYLRNPVRVAIGSVSKPAETVELHAFEVPLAQKADVLRRLLFDEKGQTLVFARTKRGTERLANNLVRDGFAAAMIHGDRSQAQRTSALSGFDAGKYKVLVATDVASRGIHVRDVAHVINYDLPTLPEDFIHRVGRTGRAGSQGRATTLVSGAEVSELRSIERALKLRIARRKMHELESDVPARKVQNTLPSRSLFAMTGEVFS